MSGYFEIYRGIANAWECDIMGHLNVQFYTGKASEGMGHFRAACGMDPGHIRRHRRTMVARTSLSRYRRELHAGDILRIEAAVLGVGEKTVDLVADIVNAGTGELSAGFDLTCAHFDLESRRALSWPDDIRARLEGMVTQRRDAPRAATTGAPGPATPTGGHAEPFISARGAVMTWECDEFGHMSARFFVARAADAIGHIKDHIGFSRDLARRNDWGSAALEYTIDFRREMKAGDIWTMHSGLIDVGEKTFRFGHVLTDDSTGEACATYDVVGCMFHLGSRKAMAIPDEIREAARQRLIAWPPAPPQRRAAAE